MARLFLSNCMRLTRSIIRTDVVITCLMLNLNYVAVAHQHALLTMAQKSRPLAAGQARSKSIGNVAIYWMRRSSLSCLRGLGCDLPDLSVVASEPRGPVRAFLFLARTLAAGLPPSGLLNHLPVLSIPANDEDLRSSDAWEAGFGYLLYYSMHLVLSLVAHCRSASQLARPRTRDTAAVVIARIFGFPLCCVHSAAFVTFSLVLPWFYTSGLTGFGHFYEPRCPRIPL